MSLPNERLEEAKAWVRVGRCPECGVSLRGQDPLKHSLTHWPEDLPDIVETKGAHMIRDLLHSMAEKGGKQ